jgi:hypothetical protein
MYRSRSSTVSGWAGEVLTRLSGIEGCLPEVYPASQKCPNSNLNFLIPELVQDMSGAISDRDH